MLIVMMSGRSFLHKIVVAFSFLIVVCRSGFAQVVLDDVLLDRLNASCVKSLDEFIQRFNGKEFHPYINTENDENLRIRSIMTLIDWQRFSAEDSNAVSGLLSFSDSVCWNEFFLDLKDGDVYAEAQCLFEYKKQEIPINLILVFENIRDDIYKWAIEGATGLVENKLFDTVKQGFINPTQHELHFSELSWACAANLSRFVSEKRKIDQLSFLAGMLKSEQLKFVICNNVRFHFMQVPNYIFVVEKKNRLDYNSGYLMCEILKVNEVSKGKYINNLIGK